jgi:hypothetical protein
MPKNVKSEQYRELLVVQPTLLIKLGHEFFASKLCEAAAAAAAAAL